MRLARAVRLFLVVALILLVNMTWDWWRFERRLSGLQDFCATAPTDITKVDAEARVRATAHLDATQVGWFDDPVRQSLMIHDRHAPGWICELALEQGVVTDHAFGADHGARRSFFDRSKPH